MAGIDYEEGEDGQQGVVGNDGAKKGNEEDDDVSSIAMSVGRVSSEQRESSVVATTARKTSKNKSTTQSVWIPKTSKTGGLVPNITYESRKPDPLGTMFRNVVEGKTETQ